MGFFDFFKSLGDSKQMITTTTFAYLRKHPELEFRGALVQSLIETRPGWNRERIDRVMPMLDAAVTNEDLVDVIVECEKRGY